MKHNYSGKSLKELKKEFGTGSKGFYEQDWYEKEAFWNEKPPKGAYEINTEKAHLGLSYEEQKEKLNGFEFPHPAVLVEAILVHYKNTGERLLEDWYSRTSVVSSGGGRVFVGYFDSVGLVVNLWDAGVHVSYLGLASARKSTESSNSEPLSTFETLNINGVTYRRVCDKCGK